MKRNVSLIVLTFEITAIVILHVVKVKQAQDISSNMARIKISAPIVKHYPLLSIK